MDRVTVYSGEVPRTVDFLQAEQNTMVAIAKLSDMLLGASGVVGGFGCAPTSPASLSVSLAAGQVFQVESLEATTWSSLNADTTDQIVKQGIALEAQNLTFTPPSTSGYSQVFLIEAEYADSDTNSTVLPYYNASNPASPFSGPGNSGSAQNTTRQGTASVQVKAGVAAATGTQVSPTQDAGWIGMWYVTLAQGQTTITSGNITGYPNAPFVSLKLPSVPAYIQAGTAEYFADSSVAANTIDVAPSPAPASIAPGMGLRIKVANAVTGAATVVVTLASGSTQTNSLINASGVAPVTGQINAGSLILVIFDGTNWQFIGASSGINPGRIVTSSATLTMLYTDYAVGLNRTSSPAAQVVDLPTTGLQVNQEFRIDDLAGNFEAYPITLTPPAGHTIAGLTTWPLNVNRAAWVVKYYGSSIWGIARCAS